MSAFIQRGRPALRNAGLCLRCRYSTETPASPLLQKLKGDLKAAMKAKDMARLNVVRNVIAEVNNSAKSSSPIKSDMQLLSLLRKRTAAAQSAAKEFEDAGRADLKEKEDAQIAILDEYAGSVETMGLDEIKSIVSKTVEEIKAQAEKFNAGDVMKKLLAPGGAFDGKPVEKAHIAKVVKELLGKQ